MRLSSSVRDTLPLYFWSSVEVMIPSASVSPKVMFFALSFPVIFIAPAVCVKSTLEDSVPNNISSLAASPIVTVPVV